MKTNDTKKIIDTENSQIIEGTPLHPKKTLLFGGFIVQEEWSYLTLMNTTTAILSLSIRSIVVIG